jgi:hypothetical protein
MKITIVQLEIEEAIRQYVQSRIQVQDGMEITMDFTSTRGDDGLIAAIDISPAKAPAKGAKGTVTRAPATTAASASLAKVNGAAPATAQVEVVGATLGDEVVAETAAAAPSVFSKSAGVDASDEQDNDRPEAEQPLRPSIFGGLKRPSNSVEDGAAA